MSTTAKLPPVFTHLDDFHIFSQKKEAIVGESRSAEPKPPPLCNSNYENVQCHHVLLQIKTIWPCGA